MRTQDVRSAIVRCPASGQRVGWGEDVGVGRAGCRPQPVADHIPTSPEAHINGGRADKVGLTHTRERAPLLIATCFAAATVHSLTDLHRLPHSPVVQVTDYIGYVCLGFVGIKDRFPFLQTLRLVLDGPFKLYSFILRGCSILNIGFIHSGNKILSLPNWYKL